MKKLTALFAATAIMFSLCACASSSKTTEEPKKGGFSFVKVTDYLFEATFDDYEQYRDDANEFFLRYNPKIGGCSSVQNGMLRGRNYDWTYDEEPEFVIHVPANDAGRHASLGVAATTEISAADVESGNDFDVYKVLPYITLDGINDAGLTVNINVVGYEEMGEYSLRTEDPSDDVCPLMIPRLLLDNAGSIEEALAMLREMDIFSLSTMEEAHFMISGKQSPEDNSFNTVVVELIPDADKHYQLSVIDYSKGDFVGNKPVMTNFHLTGYNGTLESATRHPMGYERYLLLFENFEQGSDVSGMLDLMKKVYYTRTYDLYIDNFWYSEYTGNDLDMTMVGEKDLHGDISKAGIFAGTIEDAMAIYAKNERDGSTWHTVHTSVYDIASSTLYLVPQEGGYAFTFTLE